MCDGPQLKSEMWVIRQRFQSVSDRTAPLYSLRFREGKEAMICLVSRETVMTWPMRRRMYWGLSSRLGSLTMPERASVETRYWSITHSRAERLPSL